MPYICSCRLLRDLTSHLLPNKLRNLKKEKKRHWLIHALVIAPNPIVLGVFITVSYECMQMHEDFPTTEERICRSQKEARNLFSGAFSFHVYYIWNCLLFCINFATKSDNYFSFSSPLPNIQLARQAGPSDTACRSRNWRGQRRIRRRGKMWLTSFTIHIWRKCLLFFYANDGSTV